MRPLFAILSLLSLIAARADDLPVIKNSEAAQLTKVQIWVSEDWSLLNDFQISFWRPNVAKSSNLAVLSSAPGQRMGRAKEQKHLLGGMLSLEEIKKWADTIEAQSTSNLIKFCHKPARPAHRAVIEIIFADGVNEYQIWIFREFNIIYVDAFHEGVRFQAFPWTPHSTFARINF
jgi:hypothetical protein